MTPVVFGHDRLRTRGDVEALAFSPEGDLLAVGTGFGDEASLWSLPDRTCLGRLAVAASSFAFAPEEGVLWLSYAMTRRWAFPGRDATPAGNDLGAPIALSPDGRLLVGSRPPGDREELVLHDVRSGDDRWTVPTRGVRVSSVAFSLDGQRVLVGESLGVRVLDASTGRTLEELDAPAGSVRVVAIDPQEGTLVLGARGSKRIDLRDPDGRRKMVVQLPFPLQTLALPHAGRRAAILGDGGEVAVADLADGGVRVVPIPRSPHRGAIAISDRLLATSRCHAVSLFDLETWKPLDDAPAHDDSVSAIAVSPDGAWVATAGGFDGTVRRWRTSDGAHLGAFTGHGNRIDGLAVSADGLRIASACADDRLRVFDVAKGSGKAAFEVGLEDEPAGVAFLPDGRPLVLDASGSVGAWDGRKRQAIGLGLPNAPRPPYRLATSADGRWLATSDDAGQVVVVEVATGATAFHVHGLGQVMALDARGERLALRDEGSTFVVAIPGGQIVRSWADTRAIAAGFDLRGRLAVARFDAPPVVFEPDRDTREIVLDGVTTPASVVAWGSEGHLAVGLQDGRALWLDVPVTPPTPRELDARAREERRDAARALVAALAQQRPPAGYRDAARPVTLEPDGLGAVVERDALTVRLALRAPGTKTEVRLTVHPTGADPPSSRAAEPATFASRFAGWIRRRLGRARPQVATPWLAALPGVDAASSATAEELPGGLVVIVEVDALPTLEELLRWIDACAEHAATPRA